MPTSVNMTQEEKQESFKQFILGEEKKGNLVFLADDGTPFVTPIDKFIRQPVDGILYDLNRLPEVVMTYIDDPKWVNDYAVYLVIKNLKELTEETK